jgi:beta-glucanase (GH16 family)
MNCIGTESWKKFVATLSVCTAALAALPLDTPAAHAGWSQVWADDFNSFDTGKWSKGFAWGNTFGSTPNTYYDPNNVFVSNGTLKLQAKNPGSNGYAWSGSMINTYNKAFYNPYWGYGYRFPWPPEIDIFEAPGSKNGELWYTVHYSSNGSGGSNSVHGKTNPGTVGDGKFHWYELNWWREGYSFRVDDVEQYSNWNSAARLNTNMYLLIGVEVNNNTGWHGTPPSGNWTHTMEVDRLEVYQWL